MTTTSHPTPRGTAPRAAQAADTRRASCSDLPQQPLERVLFGLAGTITLLSAGLAAAVSKWFLLLTVLVGVNQWLYVLARRCPASIVLSRVLHLQSAIYPSGRRGGERPQAQEVNA